jgi:glutamate N-acetyltransferase/amino-acid N-acetyltransferase
MTTQKSTYRLTDGDATSPQGYLAAGIHVGIKESKKDLALLVSDSVARVAATFTTNALAAAPIRVCREKLSGGRARAIVVNSGNANACTGAQGMADAQSMVQAAAAAVGADESEVFVCSTGLIGAGLPMEAIRSGIASAAAVLSTDGGADAAQAIMTTDNGPKHTATTLEVDGQTVTVGGMAKGAGMIEPNMATMLAFLTTDAEVEPGSLQACLSGVVEKTFNRISVDGSRSTNDSVFLMANGVAGNSTLNETHPAWNEFVDAVMAVARDLAWKIVKDGEGATKFVTVNVTGAGNDNEAQNVARCVGNSILVKTSWCGGDPNWGRLVDAIGYAGAAVKEEQLTVRYDDEVVIEDGKTDYSRLKQWEAVLAQDEFCVNIDLGIGAGTYTLYTCDCTEEYVRFNTAYSS